ERDRVAANHAETPPFIEEQQVVIDERGRKIRGVAGAVRLHIAGSYPQENAESPDADQHCERQRCRSAHQDASSASRSSPEIATPSASHARATASNASRRRPSRSISSTPAAMMPSKNRLRSTSVGSTLFADFRNVPS